VRIDDDVDPLGAEARETGFDPLDAVERIALHRRRIGQLEAGGERVRGIGAAIARQAEGGAGADDRQRDEGHGDDLQHLESDGTRRPVEIAGRSSRRRAPGDRVRRHQR
jgi:hypothetical protein